MGFASAHIGESTPPFGGLIDSAMKFEYLSRARDLLSNTHVLYAVGGAWEMGYEYHSLSFVDADMSQAIMFSHTSGGEHRPERVPELTSSSCPFQTQRYICNNDLVMRSIRAEISKLIMPGTSSVFGRFVEEHGKGATRIRISRSRLFSWGFSGYHGPLVVEHDSYRPYSDLSLDDLEERELNELISSARSSVRKIGAHGDTDAEILKALLSGRVRLGDIEKRSIRYMSRPGIWPSWASGEVRVVEIGLEIDDDMGPDDVVAE